MKSENRLKRIRILLFLALFFGSSFTARAQNKWEHLSWMNNPTMGSGSCVVDSLIYVFGGYTSAGMVNSTLTYNTISNKWEEKRNLPFQLAMTNVGFINDNIYLTGGWNDNGAIRLTYSYDPKQDLYSIKEPALKNSGGNASCVLNNKLYLFAGLRDVRGIDLSGQKDVQVYDSVTDEWEELQEMKHLRGIGATACVYDDKIYVFGGGYHVHDYNHYTARKPEKYDPIENTWTELAEMPIAVLNHGSLVYNNKIYIFGGDTIDKNEYPVSFIQEYDPLTDTWKLMENMPFGISNAVWQKVDNYVYLIGGYLSSSRLSDDVWRFNLDDLKEGCNEVLIREPSKSFFVGSSYALQADVLPSGFGNKSLIWWSDNQAVAKIDSIKGIFTGTGIGTATINAKLKYGNCSNSFTLTIKEGYPELVILEPSKPLAVGDNYALNLTSVFPDGSIAWSSDNKKVATVSEKGVVSCLNGGTAAITATHINDGSTDSYLLTVIGSAWVQLKSMNIAKGASRSCVIDDKIHVFGGTSSSSTTLNSAEVYNIETNNWVALTPVPIDLDYTNAGLINGQIYLAGGWRQPGSGWITLNTTYAYDPITDSWQTKKECLKKSGDNASCVLNGKLYLFGGLKDFPYRDNSGQKDAQVYDAGTDTWDILPDMKYGRGDGATACALDGQIYVFGGLNAISSGESLIIGKTEKYDPIKNTWEELAEMPVPIVYSISMEYEGKFYLFGGDSTFNPNVNPAIDICTNFIQEYNPLTNEWRLMEGMPFNRGDMTGLKVGNFAYIIGGYPENARDFSSALDEVWRFNLDSLKPMVIAHNKLINLKDVTIYPIPTNTHITIKTAISGNYNIDITTLDGQLILRKKLEGTVHQLDLSSYPVGFYFVTVSSKDFDTTRKIVKY